MNRYIGILLTLIVGVFFLVGGFVSLKIKNKDHLNHFSIGLALIIIFSLLFFDLIPEIFELLEEFQLVFKIIVSIVFVFVGIISLKILDLFIPDHHHDHHEEKDDQKEHESHVKHIGILTLLSLILHNFLEGFAIIGMANYDLKIGVLTCLSVALHNIPLGTTIFSSMDMRHHKTMLAALTFSSLVGGLIYFIVGNVSSLVLAIITLITIGMLFYIALFELSPEVYHNIQYKYTKIGLLCGIIIMVITLFL